MNLIKISVLIIFQGITAHSFSQSECLKMMRSGEFVSLAEGYEHYSIIRKKNKQVEYINYGKSKIISKVEWISDTEYKITVKKRVNIDFGSDSVPGVYTFKVTECEGTRHTMETVFKGELLVLRFERIGD